MQRSCRSSRIVLFTAWLAAGTHTGAQTTIAEGQVHTLSAPVDQNLVGLTFTGAGTLQKTGVGQIYFYDGMVSLGATGLVDVQQGSLETSGTNWSTNRADLAVATGAILRFSSDTPVQAGAITGGGLITRATNGGGPVVPNFAFGINDDSGSFAGNLVFSGYATKTGTGTQTFTGELRGFGDYWLDSPSTMVPPTFVITNGIVRIGTGGTSGAIKVRVDNQASLIFDRSDSWTHDKVIGGAGALTKEGAGTLTLSGVNTFTGSLTVNGGAVAVSADANLGAASSTVNLNGGRLAGTATVSSVRALALGAAGGAIEAAADTTFTWGGDITGAGGLAKEGAGTVVLSGNNTHAGGTQVNAGTLRLGSATAFASGSVHVADGATFDTGNAAPTLSGITGPGIINIGSGGLTVATTGTLVFDGRFGGTGTLTKSGTGALVLGEPQFNRGTTIVAEGTLRVNGYMENGAMTVASGATLGGTGAFNWDMVTIAGGGHLAPGNGVGTLTFQDGLTLADGAILDFELGATSDLLRIMGGDFNVAAATFNLTATAGYAPGDYTLINWAGATAGPFAAANFGIGTVNLGTVADYLLWIDGTKLMLTTSATAIPEPSTYAMIAGLLALGIAGWRRWRVIQVGRESF